MRAGATIVKPPAGRRRKLLWIEHTMDTQGGKRIHSRSVGGERKRVSIAEALITRASVQGWDNSSKGLDASTAVEYVKSLRALTNMAQVSTAVSLYQAGESLYELVDKVLLIDEGHCIYWMGTADEAKQYFMNLGFDRPDRWTTADFLTSVTDVHERNVRKASRIASHGSSEDFARVYKKSEAYQRNLEDIRGFEAEIEARRQARGGNGSERTKKKNYTIPFYKQVMSLVHRQFFIILGDKASPGQMGRHRLPRPDRGESLLRSPDTAAGAFTRGGVLFFILLFNALLALAEQTAAYASKPILLKHKNFSFYRPSAYAPAQTVDVPMVFVQVLLFDVIIYWMAGLCHALSVFHFHLDPMDRHHDDVCLLPRDLGFVQDTG